jgi:hypothetical protein
MEPEKEGEKSVDSAGAPSTVQGPDSASEDVDKSEKIAETPVSALGEVTAVAGAAASTPDIAGAAGAGDAGVDEGAGAAKLITDEIEPAGEPDVEVIHVRHAVRRGDELYVRAEDWHSSVAVVWGERFWLSTRPDIVVRSRAELESWK